MSDPYSLGTMIFLFFNMMLVVIVSSGCSYFIADMIREWQSGEISGRLFEIDRKMIRNDIIAFISYIIMIDILFAACLIEVSGITYPVDEWFINTWQWISALF